ncbi:lipid II flippase family protein [Janthinobacterium lividum]|uniref:lipid II flippase family protein n=1 Tax=Janthinobacterium lividum TaxID=29581 RepID=UPI0026C11D8A
MRIAGIHTRCIAISLALFSILMLLSRTSNSFLGPFLAKRVETGIGQHVAASTLLGDFHWLLFSASLATSLGAILIPTFQRAFFRAVEHFQEHRSVPKLLLHAVFKVMMAIFNDPHMPGMTDDVIEGKIEESQFRRAVVWLVGSRLAGTLIAQFLLVPSAVVIVGVANNL